MDNLATSHVAKLGTLMQRMITVMLKNINNAAITPGKFPGM